jgi:hypothetical protein
LPHLCPVWVKYPEWVNFPDRAKCLEWVTMPKRPALAAAAAGCARHSAGEIWFPKVEVIDT